jgi:L-2-hydroxyglutarate oxidase LhgO
MQVGTVIIGAGVVGLAIAARLSEQKTDIILIEKNSSFGRETSSRNSEVIHAGIYYPHQSLKARLCVEGNRRLYALCEKQHIPHRNCGKLIVAVDDDELPQLENIRIKAQQNDVNDLVWLSRDQIAYLEPSVKAAGALYSPSTGIIDSHRLMRHLAAKAQKNGVQFVYAGTVERVEPLTACNYHVHVRYPDGKKDTVSTPTVINCAGLNADLIAASMGIDIDHHGYRHYFWKGEYYSLEKAANSIQHLVYPVPHPNNEGLGIHVTIDLNGRVKLGPNATYIDQIKDDFSMDRSSQQSFFDAVKRYLPDIAYEDLNPEMVGIRPKLQRPGDSVRDFIIHEETDKGLPGVVNLLGIESPGLTASTAIAEYVHSLLSG